MNFLDKLKHSLPGKCRSVGSAALRLLAAVEAHQNAILAINPLMSRAFHRYGFWDTKRALEEATEENYAHALAAYEKVRAAWNDPADFQPYTEADLDRHTVLIEALCSAFDNVKAAFEAMDSASKADSLRVYQERCQKQLVETQTYIWAVACVRIDRLEGQAREDEIELGSIDGRLNNKLNEVAAGAELLQEAARVAGAKVNVFLDQNEADAFDRRKVAEASSSVNRPENPENPRSEISAIEAVMAFVISDVWDGEPIMPPDSVDWFLSGGRVRENGVFARHLARNGEFKIRVIPESKERELTDSLHSIAEKLYPGQKSKFLQIDCSSKPEMRAKRWWYIIVEASEEQAQPESPLKSGATVTLAGECYGLAYQTTSGGLTLNEYLRSDDTLEHWIKMIALRQWLVGNALSADQFLDVVENVLARMRSRFVAAPRVFRPPGASDQDLCVQFFLGSPDMAHVEYNLWHYVNVPSAAFFKGYQYAQRLSVNEDLEAFLRRQENQVQEFCSLDFPINF